MRAEIREIVADMKPLDALEAEHIAQVLQWIDSGAELCRLKAPDHPKLHLVSYFVVVSADKQRVLLVDHKKAKLWLPTGGHVEPGEHPRDTVCREAKEELGVSAEFVVDNPILVTVNQTTNVGSTHTDVSLWYVLKGDPSHPYRCDMMEFHAVRWFYFSEIPYKESDPNMSRFQEKLASIVMDEHYIEH